jgi:hypothetical protein
VVVTSEQGNEDLRRGRRSEAIEVASRAQTP